jgi:hypothetical protein
MAYTSISKPTATFTNVDQISLYEYLLLENGEYLLNEDGGYYAYSEQEPYTALSKPAATYTQIIKPT